LKSKELPKKSAIDYWLLILAKVFNSTIDLLKRQSLEHPLPPSDSGQSHLQFIDLSAVAFIMTKESEGYLNI
jgi:hypothetical protein